jgi:hypothetical protein
MEAVLFAICIDYSNFGLSIPMLMSFIKISNEDVPFDAIVNI